jgi:hypothetical protein
VPTLGSLKEARPDPLSAPVSEVMSEILRQGDVVAPLDVLVRLELIDADQVALWRRGGLPYLERGITSGLARVARLLKLIHEQALALGLAPTRGKYLRPGKGPNRRLRFSKRGDEASELAYGTHFIRRAGTK